MSGEMPPGVVPPPPVEDLGFSDRGVILMVVSWFCTAATISIIILRLYLRQKFHGAISADDWVMVVAMIFQIVFQVFLTLTCAAGLGHPMEQIGIEGIIDLTKWAWFTTPGSILASTIARISIAMVFVQIFGGRKWFKWLMISFTGFLVTIGLLNFIFVWCQARPVEALWDFRVTPTFRMTQMPQKIITCVLTVTFTISDFLYTVFPIAFVAKLHMEKRKKLGLIFLMAGSLITMGVAIGRTTLVFQSLFEKTDVDAGMDSEKTFIFFGVGSLLASIEQCLAIIIGTIPKLNVLSKVKFPRLQSSINTLINKLRYGSQTRSTKASKDSQPWSYSDIELNNSSSKQSQAQTHPMSHVTKPGHVAGVRGGPPSVGDDADLEERGGPGIHVTEGYAVTYKPQQPRAGF